MATEKTRLLEGYVVTLPKQYLVDENENLFVLTMAELKIYIDDPWWRGLRKGCFFSFWITIIILLLTSCTITAIEHKRNICHMKTNLNKTLTTKSSMNNTISDFSSMINNKKFDVFMINENIEKFEKLPHI